jgi:hypothetical protein
MNATVTAITGSVSWRNHVTTSRPKLGGAWCRRVKVEE